MTTTSEVQALHERLEQVRLDLSELDEQIAEGDIDIAAADRLRSVYETEIVDIETRLAAAPRASESADDGEEVPEPPAPDSGKPGLSLTAAIVGATLLAVITGLILWAGTRGPGDDVAASEPTTPTFTVPAGAFSVDDMSNQELEDALAQFPESPTVRLALADRYLTEGDNKAALSHYLLVADGATATPFERSRALARIGYLSYATGQNGPAREYLTQSLDLNHENTEAMLYMGYLFYDGLNDPEGAVPYLEGALSDPTLPQDIADDVRARLAAAGG